MKKPNKKNTVNLFFSAFLILAFVVCAHFFSNFALGQNQVLSNVIQLFTQCSVCFCSTQQESATESL